MPTRPRGYKKARSNKALRQLQSGAWVWDLEVHVTVNGKTVRRYKTIPAPERRHHGEAQADEVWHVFHQDVKRQLQRGELVRSPKKRPGRF